MRYLVKARLKEGRREALIEAIEKRTLGYGSIAGGEYLRDMEHARQLQDGSICWVEICYCATPLEEERPYWEDYFELIQVKDAHARSQCKDETGQQPWACYDCDCTLKLEATMKGWGELFITLLKNDQEQATNASRIANRV